MRKAVCDIGKGRYVCDVIKENALTTIVKLDPVGIMKELREYFMENGISQRNYFRMLREYGMKRTGITKRHNLKHRVFKYHG